MKFIDKRQKKLIKDGKTDNSGLKITYQEKP